MTYEIEVVEMAAQPALVVETECDLEAISETLAVCFGKVYTHITQNGGMPEGMPFMRYLAMTDTGFHIQAGMPSQLAGEGEIAAIQLPGGKLATTLFLGPYHEVGPAWDELHAWAEARGFDKMGGWDLYENDPSTVADESEIRTRLYLPAA